MGGQYTCRVLGALLVVSAWALPVSADVYMYRDTRGGLHFSNAPTEPQYHYYMPDIHSWKVGRLGRIDGARRKAYDKLIGEVALRHHVDSALVKAVIRAESDFVPQAVSPKGALGLMQLMPATAAMLQVQDSFHPENNIDGGVRYLRYLMNLFNGNLPLVLAAYNAGENTVIRHNNRVPPYQETQTYVRRVLGYFDKYSSAKQIP